MSAEEELETNLRVLSQIWERPNSWRPASRNFTLRPPSTVGPPPSEVDVNFLPQDDEDIILDDMESPINSDASSVTVTGSPPEGSLAKLHLDLEKIGKDMYTAPLWARSNSRDGTLHEDASPTLPPRPSPLPQPSLSRAHTVAFVMVTCCAQFLSLCSMNQTVGPVLILAEYFNIFDYGTLSWFSAAYSLSVGTFILPAGTFPS